MVETEPGLFACDTCVVRETLAGLDAANMAAWGLFHQVCTRFVIDTHAMGSLLVAFTKDQPTEEFGDLLTRLSLLYDIYYPPKRPAKGGR